MTSFLCPICKQELHPEGNSFVCENHHCFDKAKSGYINLLPSSKMNSKNPGDSKEMVASRREFLNKGYYDGLRCKIAEKAAQLAPAGSVYLDAGCGTGYYTSAVIDALDNATCFGIDISKFAADTSAKREKRGLFAVASLYDIPLANECVDVISNVFSPMADSEYNRILKNGAHILYVVPAPRHLYSLKELLYDEPYENEVIYPNYDGFDEVERTECAFDIELKSSLDIEELFTMTPYFWRTPQGALEKLRSLDTLKTRAEFYIITLRKR